MNEHLKVEDLREMAFQKESIFRILGMNSSELDSYYREKRKAEAHLSKRTRGKILRRRVHPVLLEGLRIDRKMKNEKIVILSDQRRPHKGGAIFAVTHIGGNDVERAFEVIGEHAYIMLGDPGIFYKSFDGLFMQANGWVPVDTRDAVDRQIAYRQSLDLLKRGDNLLIFPEGAYNVFENLPVMHLFPGAVKLAKETGCDIIPVALEQYDNVFYARIGKNMRIPEKVDYKRANRVLRDALATLKWQIWETKGLHKRESFSKEYAENYRESVVNKVVHKGYSYTLQDVYETMYHVDRNVKEQIEL